MMKMNPSQESFDLVNSSFEPVVEPLFRSEKKRYRPLSRSEIFQRCVRLSREINSDAAGSGFLHNASSLEGRAGEVEGASPAKTPECGCLKEKSLKSGSKKAGVCGGLKRA
jgi:hypothetical protein